jgi:L-ascorbate metabolism protein UlaG (beta-lactamase superfamily)
MMVMRRMITLTWHGHSCFSINNGTWTLVLDPYDPKMVGYPPLSVQAHAFLASHQHGDHNWRAAVKLLPGPADLVRKVDPAGKLPAAADPAFFYCKSVETNHDDAGGSKRGKNLVHVIYTQGFAIAHLGDLGHVLTDDQIDKIGRPDLLLVPTGGHFTIDAMGARQVIRQLQPENITPMHYQIGFGNLPITGVEPFLKLVAAEWTIQQLGKPVLQLDSGQTGNCFVFHYQAGV